MSFVKKLDNLNFALSLKKDQLRSTINLIDSMKSTFNSYKLTKINFKQKIDSLPHGDIRKKGGNILSRQSFVNIISKRGSLLRTDADQYAGQMAALGFNLQKSGGIKKLKKLRKAQALSVIKIEKDIGRIKFIRRHGRIIPIRVKQ